MSTPHVCDWPGCLRASRSGRTRFCDRHRPYCAASLADGRPCHRRAMADRPTCRAHRYGNDPPSPQPASHRRQLVTCVACGGGPTVATSLCMRCYQRKRRTGTTAEPWRAEGGCRYCAERATGPDGLCTVHRRRMASLGDIAPLRTINRNRVCSNADGRPAWRGGICVACYFRARRAAAKAANLDAGILVLDK